MLPLDLIYSLLACSQWRNEFEWRPTAKFKWLPYKVQHFYCFQKETQKNTKKRSPLFFGFSYTLVPGAFLLPNFFPPAPPNVNLAPLIAILAPPEPFCTPEIFFASTER